MSELGSNDKTRAQKLADEIDPYIPNSRSFITMTIPERELVLKALRAYSGAQSADAGAKAFGDGILAAANEVGTHWNDGHTMVNQREQALRSASVLRNMPLARSAMTALPLPLTMEKIDKVQNYGLHALPYEERAVFLIQMCNVIRAAVGVSGVDT